MSKYRFKTQEEFIKDGQWDDDNHCPVGWAQTGEMNYCLGQDVPEEANENCDLHEGFDDDGWWFERTNYVLKQSSDITFYVRYCPEFTEGVYNALMEWCKTNTKAKQRAFEDNYAGLIRYKYFNVHSVSYGVDNNHQIGFTKQEYTVDQVKALIGYTISEDYTGRWIKALVENPSCTGVRLGEVIKIIGKPSSYILDKTASGIPGMSIPYPLQTSKWELVEEPKNNSDDILEKARRLYPIGTEFISNLGSFGGSTQTVQAQLNWYDDKKESITHSGIGWVYFDGKWAEIVKPAPSKVVPEYVRCIEVPEGWKITKKDTIYKTDEYSGGTYRIIYHEEGGGQTTVGKEHCFVPATKQEYDAQFLNEKDPLYICKQEYRKGMKVKSASKTGAYAGEFIIDVDPKEFRYLSGNIDIVDYSCSNGYLYYKGEYAEILEEGIYDVSEIIETNKPSVDDYLTNSGFAKSNPEAYNWLMKPSIETVHSVDVNLRTKKQINKFKF